MDLTEAVLNLIAFVLADQLRETNCQNHPSRWRSNASASGTVEAITAEVLKRLANADEADFATVRDAVEDTLAELRRRW